MLQMIKKLALTPYLNAEKYGIIQLTKQGQELGAYLLKRHEIIEQFLIIIGVKENVLEETEKIEHNVSSPTLECIAKLVQFLKENNKWQQR